MSFPNPDNYARDCDCGTSGANTTPPPASLITEASAAILTNPLILPLGGTINTSNHNNGGTGGSINTSGGYDGNGGSINLSNNGGSIISVGDSEFLGGTLNMSSALVDGDATAGGSINTSGGGSINLSACGGSINLSGDGGGTYGGSITSVAVNGWEGGSINLNAGSTNVGGSINTSSDGGSIDTTGTGSIGFGVTATRTTLNGSATAARTVTLPNVTGTLPIALISTSTSLNFGSITTGNFADLTITLTGAATGDVTFVTCVETAGRSGTDRQLVFEAFVSAINTVTVRAHNPTSGSIDPAAYNFKVAIIKTA